MSRRETKDNKYDKNAPNWEEITSWPNWTINELSITYHAIKAKVDKRRLLKKEYTDKIDTIGLNLPADMYSKIIESKSKGNPTEYIKIIETIDSMNASIIEELDEPIQIKLAIYLSKALFLSAKSEVKSKKEKLKLLARAVIILKKAKIQFKNFNLPADLEKYMNCYTSELSTTLLGETSLPDKIKNQVTHPFHRAKAAAEEVLNHYRSYQYTIISTYDIFTHDSDQKEHAYHLIAVRAKAIMAQSNYLLHEYQWQTMAKKSVRADSEKKMQQAVHALILVDSEAELEPREYLVLARYYELLRQRNNHPIYNWTMELMYYVKAAKCSQYPELGENNNSAIDYSRERLEILLLEKIDFLSTTDKQSIIDSKEPLVRKDNNDSSAFDRALQELFDRASQEIKALKPFIAHEKLCTAITDLRREKKKLEGERQNIFNTSSCRVVDELNTCLRILKEMKNLIVTNHPSLPREMQTLRPYPYQYHQIGKMKRLFTDSSINNSKDVVETIEKACRFIVKIIESKDYNLFDEALDGLGRYSSWFFRNNDHLIAYSTDKNALGFRKKINLFP